jgi:hypothetical protein
MEDDLDHSATTAVCGIHPKGKPPHAAAAEIARTVARMIEQRDPASRSRRWRRRSTVSAAQQSGPKKQLIEIESNGNVSRIDQVRARRRARHLRSRASSARAPTRRQRRRR